jgi:hypothetical protein
VTKSPTSTSPPTALTLSPASSKPSTVTANPTTKRPSTKKPTTIEPTDEPTYFPTYNPTSDVPTTTETPIETPTEPPNASPDIEITVSGGDFSSPYFNFEVDDDNMDVESYEFIPGSKYKFVGGPSLSSFHPFFISDLGRETASSSFVITSTKAYNTGIKVGESLEFQLPSNFSGTLTYYCVPHDEMTNTFNVASPTTTTTMNTPFEVNF